MRGALFIKRFPNILQHDASDCAAAVIATILKTYKQDISLMKIREKIGTDSYGTSISGIVRGLTGFQFNVKAVRVPLKEINNTVTLPAILYVTTKAGMNHFVVLHKITRKNQYIIADPSKEGTYRASFDALDDLYSGVSVFMAPNSEFEKLQYKDKSMIELFKALILPQKRLLGQVLMASLLLSFFGIFASMFSKIIMDEVIPYHLRNSLFVFLIVFGVVAIIQNVLSAFRQQVLLYLSRKIDIPLLMGYYNHILHLPFFFFSTRSVGDVITRFQDAMTIKDIFTSVSISLIMDILLATISSVFLWNINRILFGILIFMILLNVILVYGFKKSYKKLNYEQMESGSHLNSQLIESIQNIETVKAVGDEKQQIETLEKRFVRNLEIGYKEGTLQNTQSILAGLITSVGNLIFMGVGALLIMGQKMTIGDLLVFQTLSQYFTEPVQNLVSLQMSFQEAQIAMKRLSEIMSLDREDKIQARCVNVDWDGDIEFKDVSFSYGSRAPIIKDMNLQIKAGTRVAFVGESGAGKSTIVRFLLRFVTPTEGEVSISDQDIEDINISELRNKIAYIPQNIELFSGTIIDNLKVGNEHATYEQMVMACKKTGASYFIDKLPNKYGTYIEEGGTNLSGGEKQRLAIARAILKDPSIYIFDESTSNLDSFSEIKVQELLFQRIRSKTMIIIAHRLSTIRQCDVIYFIEKGKIIEFGTHEDLVAMNGKYARMNALQNMAVNTGESRARCEVNEGIMVYE